MKSLLKVTRKAELGLLIVSELAHRAESEGPLSLEEIARKSGDSRKFLEQVAGELRRADLIHGVRGAQGGYRLARKADDITVVEVLNAVEGPMELDACTAHKHGAELGIIKKVQGQVMATLMNTKISELA